MVPILVFESIFILVELVYFLFADILGIAMVGFYGYEAICLVLFGLITFALVLLFFINDPFLITELVLMSLLLLLDIAIIIIIIIYNGETPILLDVVL